MEALRRATGAETQVQQRKQKALQDARALNDGALSMRGTVAALSSTIRSSSVATVSRLNAAAELNQTKLKQAQERIQAQLNEIDDFIRETGLVSLPPLNFTDLQASPPCSPAVTPATMCKFLRHAHNRLPRASELAMSQKQPDAAVNIAPLPQESKAEAANLKQFPQLFALLKVKEELLHFAMASRKGLLSEQEAHEANLQRMHAQARKEMEEWKALAARMQKEIRQLNSKCVFCGVQLSGQAASTLCEQNRYPPTYPGPAYDGQRREGDGRHYFVAVN
jgi:hypothetical protein